MKVVKNNKQKNGAGFDDVAVSKLRKIAKLGRDDCYTALGSTEEGLWPRNIADKVKRFGLNEIQHTKAPAWYVQLLLAFINPFIAVLMVLGLISFVTDIWLTEPGQQDYKTVTVVTVMVLLSSLLRFWQEYTSSNAAEQLKNMVKTTATVLRKAVGKREIELKKIVPGDVIYLSAGDMIPADIRILQSKDLFVSQSMLTGESMPVEKSGTALSDTENQSPLELDNICFMGTNVVSGTAVAIAVNTGKLTYFGAIGKAGPVSSIFDYMTFAVLFFVFKANSPAQQALFQTGWFVEGLLSQTLIVHMIRTRKIPFLQSWATAPVVALTSLVMLIGIAIPFSPFAAAINLQPLPMGYFPWLIGILTCYCLLTQYIKNRFIQKFHQWL